MLGMLSHMTHEVQVDLRRSVNVRDMDTLARSLAQTLGESLGPSLGAVGRSAKFKAECDS